MVRAQARGATVAVTQAGAVPGTAKITVTDDAGVPATYEVNFAHRARSDDFPGATVGPQWSWIRENPTTHSLTSSPGSLVITPEAGDLNAATNTARNLLVQPALGDWTIESKLVFSSAPHVNTQQAGIVAYSGDDDYLKLDLGVQRGAARPSETSEDSLSGAPVVQALTALPTVPIFGTATTVWLGWSKTGPRYTHVLLDQRYGLHPALHDRRGAHQREGRPLRLQRTSHEHRPRRRLRRLPGHQRPAAAPPPLSAQERWTAASSAA